MIIQLIRRPSVTMAASMFHRRLIGLSPATTSRSLGFCTNTAAANQTKRVSDKQAKIETIFSLEGLKASQLKTVLPLLQQHFNVNEARRVVYKHLGSEAVVNKFRIECHSKVTIDGFEESELETLRPCIKHYASVGADVEEEVKKCPKINLDTVEYAKLSSLS